ncbi:MAG TPA: PBP1A family penicillin-binding protein [Devosiaceae bacterium]|jgi:penicillin-binding protein 1A
MEFRISQDDRVGASPRSKAKAGSGKASAGGKRVEPTMGAAVGTFVDDERSGRTPPGKPQKRGKTQKLKGRKPRKRRTAGSFLVKIFYWFFILCVWGGIAVAGVVVYFAAQLPASNTWAIPARPANIRIVAADGQLISNRGKTGGEAISLQEMPYYVPEAVIAIEDRRFMSHFGVDPIGIMAALMDNFRAGGLERGGSTITQQLAKNLFLTPDQTFGRKVQEAVLALWLERNYTKDQIIELYLNRMFFGHNAYGIEAAAQTYFGKSARNLSLAEAATLAGTLKGPSSYNPKSNPQRSAERQKLVLQAMADEGYISQDEAKAATIDPNQPIRTRVAGSEGYVADWVETLMQSYLGDIKQDVIVHTTINWDLQKQAEFLVKEAVAKNGPKRGFSQGALVAMDTDGTVRAMVGGVDYAKSQYNRAITAHRQPGSAFKPFVYLAAMEKGYTPDTIADDAPFTYNGWSPENASHKFAGPVTLRTGLTYSLNTIAARLAIDVTPQVVVNTAMRLGISSPLEAVPSIALGTSGVSLLELTAAYAPFANNGQGVIANVITSIETSDGKVLYQATPAGPGQVIDPYVVGEMNDMLGSNVEVGTGKAAHIPGWQIAGKTGTSQKGRDAVFVGYSARMVTGVWLGNDDDTKTSLSGGSIPAQIWSDFMTKAHKGLQVANLPHGPAPNAALADAPMRPMMDAAGNPVLTPDGEQVYEPIPAGEAQVPSGAAAPQNNGQTLQPPQQFTEQQAPADGKTTINDLINSDLQN